MIVIWSSYIPILPLLQGRGVLLIYSPLPLAAAIAVAACCCHSCSVSGISSSNYYYSQRVHVGIWYILRTQRCTHIPTLRSKYIPCSYIHGPFGIAPPETTSTTASGTHLKISSLSVRICAYQDHPTSTLSLTLNPKP